MSILNYKTLQETGKYFKLGAELHLGIAFLTALGDMLLGDLGVNYQIFYLVYSLAFYQIASITDRRIRKSTLLRNILETNQQLEKPILNRDKNIDRLNKELEETNDTPENTEEEKQK